MDVTWMSKRITGTAHALTSGRTPLCGTELGYAELYNGAGNQHCKRCLKAVAAPLAPETAAPVVTAPIETAAPLAPVLAADAPADDDAPEDSITEHIRAVAAARTDRHVASQIMAARIPRPIMAGAVPVPGVSAVLAQMIVPPARNNAPMNLPTRPICHCGMALFHDGAHLPQHDAHVISHRDHVAFTALRANVESTRDHGAADVAPAFDPAFRIAFDVVMAARAARKAGAATLSARTGGRIDAVDPRTLASVFTAFSNPLAAAGAASRAADAVADRTRQLAREARADAAWIGGTVARERSAMWRAIIGQFIGHVSLTVGRTEPFGPLRRACYGPITATGIAAEMWRVVADRTAGAGYVGWARAISTTYAAEATGRMTGDYDRVQTVLDDVVNGSRIAAFNALWELAHDDNAVPCDGTCGADGCAAELVNPRVLAIDVDGSAVIGWHVTYDVKCGECEACANKRGVKHCENPTEASKFVSLGAVVGAQLKKAAREVFKIDVTHGVDWFSGTADQFAYGEIVSAEARQHEATAPDTRAVPASIWRAAETAVAAADAAGMPVMALNGRPSTFVLDTLAVIRGGEATERGRRSVRADLIDTRKSKRTGAPRTSTLGGAARPDARTQGTRLGKVVEQSTETIRVSRDPRTAPRPM